ncbi:MAG: hypothetical protein ABIO70_26620 [Pseudomonadota bacterium]
MRCASVCALLLLGAAPPAPLPALVSGREPGTVEIWTATWQARVDLATGAATSLPDAHPDDWELRQAAPRCQDGAPLAVDARRRFGVEVGQVPGVVLWRLPDCEAIYGLPGATAAGLVGRRLVMLAGGVLSQHDLESGRTLAEVSLCWEGGVPPEQAGAPRWPACGAPPVPSGPSFSEAAPAPPTPPPAPGRVSVTGWDFPLTPLPVLGPALAPPGQEPLRGELSHQLPYLLTVDVPLPGLRPARPVEARQIAVPHRPDPDHGTLSVAAVLAAWGVTAPGQALLLDGCAQVRWTGPAAEGPMALARISIAEGGEPLPERALAPAWVFETGEEIRALTPLGDSLLVTTSAARRLLDPEGRERWAGPVTREDRFGLLGDTLIVAGKEAVRAVDLGDGADRWLAPGQATTATTVVIVTGGGLLPLRRGDALVALDAGGRERWAVPWPGQGVRGDELGLWWPAAGLECGRAAGGESLGCRPAPEDRRNPETVAGLRVRKLGHWLLALGEEGTARAAVPFFAQEASFGDRIWTAAGTKVLAYRLGE